jgi:general secretion pathway protein D
LAASRALLDLVPAGVDPLVPGFSALFSSAENVRTIISALERVTDVDVISSPQLLVLDNQTAQLQVGDEVPVIIQKSQGTGEDSRIINSVEQHPTGVILNVTARVNASGVVIMEIEQEVSDVVPTSTSAIDSPNRNQAGVPVLSSIPVVGWMFGQEARRRERTELLILLTPHAVSSQNEARAVTDELRRRLWVLEEISTPYFAQLGNGAQMLDANTRRASARRLALRIRGWEDWSAGLS